MVMKEMVRNEDIMIEESLYQMKEYGYEKLPLTAFLNWPIFKNVCDSIIVAHQY